MDSMVSAVKVPQLTQPTARADFWAVQRENVVCLICFPKSCFGICDGTIICTLLGLAKFGF